MGELRKLNLGGMDGLEFLPESLTCLVKLEHLGLERCYSLVDFPPGMTALTALKVLDMRNCSADLEDDFILSEALQILGNPLNSFL